MSRWHLRLSKDAEKTFFKIRQSLPVIGTKIQKKIDELESNPRLGSKLEGADGEVRRIKLGDYRIVYEVYRTQILILVIYIGPRGSAYKRH